MGSYSTFPLTITFFLHVALKGLTGLWSTKPVAMGYQVAVAGCLRLPPFFGSAILSRCQWQRWPNASAVTTLNNKLCRPPINVGHARFRTLAAGLLPRRCTAELFNSIFKQWRLFSLSFSDPNPNHTRGCQIQKTARIRRHHCSRRDFQRARPPTKRAIFNADGGSTIGPGGTVAYLSPSSGSW